jgi:hypothetical protein
MDMRNLCVLSVLLAIAAGGCNACREMGMAMPGSGFASMWQGPMPTPMEPMITPTQPPPAPLGEQITQMAQRVASADDDRKALTARLQLLEEQLTEKDKALVHGNLEVREATQQVQAVRQEIHRWKQESESLRAKLQNSEKENRETLEAVIRSMEQVVDRDGKDKLIVPKVR